MPPVNIRLGAGAKPKGRRVHGNSPNDRIPRGPDCHRLKRVCADFFPACSFARLTILRALRMRFLRHRGIYLVRCSSKVQTNLRTGTVPPPAGRSRARRQATRREDRAPSHRPQMSSGRLFLDRVGRHQSPSPLHRHEQINMRSQQPRSKGDISTLPARGHFYFALTQLVKFLTFLT